MLVAERLAATARSSDLVTRFAGDEFVVLCPDLPDAATLTPITTRLRDAVAAPVNLDGKELRPQLSIGTAVARDGDMVEDLLRRADQSMYAAKRANKRARGLNFARAPIARLGS